MDRRFIEVDFALKDVSEEPGRENACANPEEIEGIRMKADMEFEIARGRKPEDVSAQNLGCTVVRTNLLTFRRSSAPLLDKGEANSPSVIIKGEPLVYLAHWKVKKISNKRVQLEMRKSDRGWNDEPRNCLRVA